MISQVRLPFWLGIIAVTGSARGPLMVRWISGDVLAAAKVSNAAVDLDALVWQWPSSSKWNSGLMFENLLVPVLCRALAAAAGPTDG